MSTAVAEEDPGRTYGMWTKPRSEGIFGLTWPVTLGFFAAIVTVLGTAALAGPRFAGVLAVIELAVLIPAAVTIDGQTSYERGIAMWQWVNAVRRRETIYRSGAFSHFGSARLPGLMAAAKLHEFPAAAGPRFGMIHYPDHHLYTVMLKAWPQGARAVDQPLVNQWVGAWGQFLASLGGQADIMQICVVNDTVPETGNRLAAEVDGITRPGAPKLAKQIMAEAALELPSDSVRSESWVSISFKATTPTRRKNPEEQAVEIGRRMGGIVTALADAGVRVKPMNATEIIALVRRAWDPAAEPDLEEAAERRMPHGISWADAGPVSYDEHKGHLWHDGTASVTWEMREAPAGTVRERVLQRLIEPNLEVPRKRVTLVYRPHSAGDATAIVDDDYRNALTAVNASRNHLGSAHSDLRVKAADLARDQQAAGHGVTRFAVLVTVTARDDGGEHADIPGIDAIARDLSVQSRLKIRRCHRYQAAAFAACLGAGVILPEMARMPKVIA
ncbi:SCO6880 family protein [Nocardia brasiliensis]|uniref:SCO6880 family protein n=1 Tax=Nocardia brasiliensis TaxID=37326 RepID=UPI0024579CB7|nr:SCO6880 family protein [Nocardia brasiliensis]